ncbi:tRNA lysidine(34) synthetase TilS [bacterium]|nr:tRNA lysidine(34) synthetase TilS [bacterium]
MNLVNKVSKELKRNWVNNKDKIILAVSGGVDSVVLLDIISKLFKKEKIVVAHFNHGLRSDSVLDQSFVKALAKSYGLKFVTKNENNLLNQKGNLEENARIARYMFLAKVAKNNKANLVVTAHHADDQLETVIMNNQRGAFLEGLTGMQSISISNVGQGSTIFRPMLNILKSQIISYQIKNDLQFKEDGTNLDTKYTRNKIRHLILSQTPDKEKLSLLKDINNLSKTYNLLKNQINKIFYKSSVKSAQNFLILNKPGLVSLKKDVLQEVIKKSILELTHNLQNITFVNIESVGNTILKKVAGKEIHLQNNLLVLVDNDYVIFTKKKFNQPLIKKQKISLGVNTVKSLGLDILITESNHKNKDVMCLDADKVKFPIYIKSYENGMKIKLKNVGTKKLQDFFVDRKIEKRYRKGFPLVVDAKGELLAIIDLAVSEYCLPDRKTVKYLFIEVKNKN